MANLSNPTFEVDILTGLPNDYQVRGTVNVELSPFETFLVNAGLPLQLQSNIFGDDGGFLSGGADDLLFSFTTQNITSPGTYSFSAIIPRGVLNEDNSLFNRDDEVYSKFSLVSGTNLFPLNVQANSSLITGKFG
jgi:hypothetical protein